MKKTRKLLLMLLALVLSLSLVLTACGGDSKEPAQPSESNDTPETEEEDVVEDTGEKVLRLSGMSIETLNQHVYSSSSEGDVQDFIYSGLLMLLYDPDTNGPTFMPYHAEDLPKTEDNIVWTIKVKDDAQWTDGTPITAESFEYSWRMLLDPKLANRNAMTLMDNIKVKNATEYYKGEVEDWEEVGIKVLDDNTLEITLEDEMPEIDVLLALASISTTPVYEELYEAGMNEDRTETTYATTLDVVKSSGRYTLVEWVRDQHRSYVKNEDAPHAELFKPEKIEERVISESSTRLQLFESGELDVASVTTEIEQYEDDPRVVYPLGNTIWGFFINSKSSTNPVLQDKNFRQALFYGINRTDIAKGVFKLYEETPWYISSVPMVNWETGDNYKETPQAKAIRPKEHGYDTDKAVELFEKAYEANGGEKISIEIIYFEAQESMKRMAEVAEEQYENLFGADKIDVVLRAMDPSTAYDQYEAGDFDLGIGAYGQSAFNPWSSMKVWTSDFPGKSHAYASPEFDELYARSTTGDLKLKVEERIDALAQMEELLIDYVPQIPIFQNNNASIYSDRIHLITNGEYISGIGFGLIQSEIDGL